MDKTTIYIPTELHAELKAIARRSGRPQAEVIREALATYVAQQERPWPRSFGIAESGQVSAADSEDWLRENWEPDW
jgi:predicted transcriptional regulator